MMVQTLNNAHHSDHRSGTKMILAGHHEKIYSLVLATKVPTIPNMSNK